MPILEDGQLFERYRVHKWLGGGVAGESYEAEDRILQRKVTLKLIHPWSTLADSARRQFFREMQGISLLNHPFLATVLDYGEIDGRIYVARRYVSSGSLLSTNGRLWFHPPLAAPDAFKYAHQLAQALQYVHQHGYLHGSLTFANVLVLRGPNTENDPHYAPFLVADVGLAHFARRFGQPRIETLPVSAAPEQLGKRTTPASDQFALAVLLYFWLAGRPPYLGNAHEIETQKLSETITPLNMLNPGITRDQNNIITRALTVYPEDRYPSVLAFADELLASLSKPREEDDEIFALPSLTPQPTVLPDADKTQAGPAAPEELAFPPTHDASIPAQTSQVPPETYRSAFEQLLAQHQQAQSQAENETAASESYHPPLEKEQGPDREETFTFLPALPETPHVEAHTLPITFPTILPTEPPVVDIPDISSSGFPIEQPGAPSQAESAEKAILDVPAESVADASVRAIPAEPSTADESSIHAASEQPATELPAAAPDHSADNAPVNAAPDRSADDTPAAAAPDRSADNAPVDAAPDHSADNFPVNAAPDRSADNAPIELTAAAGPPISDALSTLAHTLPNESVEADPLRKLSIELEAERPIGSPTADALDILTFEFPGEIPIAETLDTLAMPSTAYATSPAEPSADAETSSSDTHLTSAGEKATDSTSDAFLSSIEEMRKATNPLPNIYTTTPLPELTPEVPEQQPAPAPAQTTNASAPPREESIDAVETNISPRKPELETERAAEARSSAPLQESREEVIATTYPPIEEVIVAPRLLISSPYTNSSYEYSLSGEEVNIGRAGSSDLYLEQDNLTSRHHALIKRIGERVLIFDKRSQNGVFINGQRIEVGRAYELADGDHIGIGSYELIFRSSSGRSSQLI